MLDREAEIDAFKRVDLSVIAASYGFEVEKKRTTKHCVMMTNGSDKIAISYNGKHYVYWDVNDRQNNGTVVDFVQNMIERGCHLGRVRQLLRPFLNAGHVASVRNEFAGRYATEIKPSQTDLLAVAARYADFLPIAHSHNYLCDVRGIPFDLLQSERLRGRIRHCPRRGSVIFPHYGCPTGTGSPDRCLTGYEIKGEGVNMFSKGGRKGLFISAARAGDQRIAVAESGLDAISYLAVRGNEKTRVVSISGKLNTSQPALLASAIEHLGQGQVIAAFDNDEAGDELTRELSGLVGKLGRAGLQFVEDRAPQRGADWNQVLLDRTQRVGHFDSLSLQFGR